MDLDGTISSEVAIIKKKEDYDNLTTMGLAQSNDGKEIPAVVTTFRRLKYQKEQRTSMSQRTS